MHTIHFELFRTFQGFPAAYLCVVVQVDSSTAHMATSGLAN